MCADLESILMSLKRKGNFISGYDIKEVQDLSFRILSEYIKLIRTGISDEETLDKIREDIQFSLSNFVEVDRRGTLRMKDLIKEWTGAVRDKNLDYFLPVFITPIITFLHSRIYDSLIETHNLTQRKFLSAFVMSTSKKALALMPKKEEEKLVEREKEKE
jgi:hypothetical protein